MLRRMSVKLKISVATVGISVKARKPKSQGEMKT